MGNASLASSGLRVFAGVCAPHIRAVPHDEIKTREEINHTKSWLFESQTNQVKGREDSTILINLEKGKERLPQVSMKYRGGSFIFAL